MNKKKNITIISTAFLGILIFLAFSFPKTLFTIGGDESIGRFLWKTTYILCYPTFVVTQFVDSLVALS
ncbi:MAG: hypothetical protein KOO69_05950, partial [Victivallales bacterium]|nr:hypothetical protein [Victivallales bacterium]